MATLHHLRRAGRTALQATAIGLTSVRSGTALNIPSLRTFSTVANVVYNTGGSLTQLASLSICPSRHPGHISCRTFTAASGPSSSVAVAAPDIEEVIPDENAKKDAAKTRDFAAEAKLLFDTVWTKLEKRYGRENLVFPKEIMWLAGAPGAGKGTMTPFIMKERGFTADPVEISQLLTSEQAKALKDQGLMVGDQEVAGILFEKLLDESYTNGIIVDGFPRTPVQGECIKLLYDKMKELKQQFDSANSMYKHRFKRPVFHVTVLYIDENEAVRRQLARGRYVKTHNARVRETGVGKFLEERLTDSDESLSRQRYRVFKEQVQSSLNVIKDRFHFHFVNADGTVEEVQDRITKEFAYQSSLELADDTFAKISQLPLAKDLTKHARQELVRRLDMHQSQHTELFDKVLDVLKKEFLHIIRRQALAGKAIIRTENSIFDEPLAVDVALDVLAERGFVAVLDQVRLEVPDSLDPQTHRLVFKRKKVWQFQLEFTRPQIRHE